MTESSNPWMFHRDELDVLEDEIDLLQQKFFPALDLGVETFEAVVLREQLDTEEASDTALSKRLGLTDESLHVEASDGQVLEDAFAELSSGQDVFRRHPLYQFARTWSAQVRTFSKQGYESASYNAEAFFRAYVNAHTVPIKVFTGLCEESFVDMIGLEVAEQEYALALTYIQRILTSLSMTVSNADTFEALSAIHARGEELRAILVGKLAEIRRKK